MDKCPEHGTVEGLNTITLGFLPPSTTALLQPMDQNTIQVLKAVQQIILLCMDQRKEDMDTLVQSTSWRQVVPVVIVGFTSPVRVWVQGDDIRD